MSGISCELREHMPADAAVVQEAVAALVAAHGDMRHRVDPQPRRLAATDAAIEQIDVGRNFREQRIERLVQQLEPRHFGVAQVDDNAGALGGLDARLVHRLVAAATAARRLCRRVGFPLTTPHGPYPSLKSLDPKIHQQLRLQKVGQPAKMYAVASA